MDFFGGATSLDSFLKAYKTSKTEGFFPYECFDCPQETNDREVPHYGAFFNTLRNVNFLERHFSDYQKMHSFRLMTEEALSKMKFSKPPPSGEETYQYLFGIRNYEIMCTFEVYYAGTTTKTLSQHSKQCKKRLFFITRKESTC